jgi:hypothetical protein
MKRTWFSYYIAYTYACAQVFILNNLNLEHLNILHKKRCKIIYVHFGIRVLFIIRASFSDVFQGQGHIIFLSSHLFEIQHFLNAGMKDGAITRNIITITVYSTLRLNPCITQ